MRSLLWLVAMAAFLLPSLVGPVAAADRVTHPVAGGCHDAPPPPPCPDEDTAKHAAGLCCPLMAGAVAVLSSAAAGSAGALAAPFGPDATPHLAGLSPHKDPPPPRV